MIALLAKVNKTLVSFFIEKSQLIIYSAIYCYHCSESSLLIFYVLFYVFLIAHDKNFQVPLESVKSNWKPHT